MLSSHLIAYFRSRHFGNGDDEHCTNALDRLVAGAWLFCNSMRKFLPCL